jgi:hypothetical protein
VGAYDCRVEESKEETSSKIASLCKKGVCDVSDGWGSRYILGVALRGVACLSMLPASARYDLQLLLHGLQQLCAC